MLQGNEGTHPTLIEAGGEVCRRDERERPADGGARRGLPVVLEGAERSWVVRVSPGVLYTTER